MKALDNDCNTLYQEYKALGLELSPLKKQVSELETKRKEIKEKIISEGFGRAKTVILGNQNQLILRKVEYTTKPKFISYFTFKEL